MTPRLRNRSGGQATVEYILMLFVVVSLATILAKKFLEPTFNLIANSLGEKIESTLFKPGAMHRFRIGR